MGIVKQAASFAEARFAFKAGIPLPVWLETKYGELAAHRPPGERIEHITIQPDGSIVTAEMVRVDDSTNDELPYRMEKGDSRTNILLQEAARAREDILRHEIEMRDQAENIREYREAHDRLLKEIPTYYFIKREARKNMFLTLLVILGDFWFMALQFGDLIGVDPTRIGAELHKHPVQVLGAVTLTISFFIAAMLLSRQVLHSNRKWLWAICLAFVGFIVGIMRGTSGIQESDINTWYLIVLYTMLTIILPLAAAFYARKWDECSKIIGQTDSALRRLSELEQVSSERMRESERERELARERLEKLTREISTVYEKSREERRKTMAEWEAYSRYVEAYLARLRYFYLFWQGWQKRKEEIPRLAKKTQMIASTVILAAALSLVARSANADGGFNMAVICDRSSSAAEYSCTPEKIIKAGEYWAGKADDAGGGNFTIYLIDQGFDSTTILLSQDYPESFPGPVMMHKRRWNADFMQRLENISLPKNKGSAIAEAIFRASLRIPKDGETVVYILSDMREVNRVFDFERRVPSSREFLDWLNRKGIRPKFSKGTRVIVCGVHPYSPDNTSRMKPETYDRLVSLWRAVFEQWRVKATISETYDFRENK